MSNQQYNENAYTHLLRSMLLYHVPSHACSGISNDGTAALQLLLQPTDHVIGYVYSVGVHFPHMHGWIHTPGSVISITLLISLNKL
jgi:hypothetical protein